MQRIECEGAPRDLGIAQGWGCKKAVRDFVARSGQSLRRRRYPVLKPWSSGEHLGAGPGREVIRHYPHLAERMAGLAIAADLPLESLVASLVRPAPSVSDVLTAPTIALAGDSVHGEAFASRTLLSSVPGAAWILRRSRPEVGFPSVELTLPWLASAVAGVNAEGVAVLLARTDTSTGGGAPPLLLVQECLQRFASVDGCLDWCLKRGAAGRALLFIAHAVGGVAAVEFDGSERRVIRPSDGLLVEGASAAAEAELRKTRERPSTPAQPVAVAQPAAVDPVDAEVSQGRGDSGHDAGSIALRLEPDSCRLIVRALDSADFEGRTELVAT